MACIPRLGWLSVSYAKLTHTGTAWHTPHVGRLPYLQDCKDRDIVVQQGAGREHGRQVEQQVRVLLKLVRERALEGVLKGRRRRGGNAVPALRRSPMIVVDCAAGSRDGQRCNGTGITS